MNQRQVISVTDLNRKAKQLLEVHLPLIWVEGEISNLSRPSSGHWYFTLKDEKAQVRCAMFRGRNSHVKFQPKAGDLVQVRGRVSLYEGRGDFQLIAEHMEEAGFGLLQRRFNELKEKLFNEGLFDDANKKEIPSFPKHVGVITSASGAAIRDVVSVMERRFPSIPITVIPSLVQGDEAPEQLVSALELAEKSKRFDVLLLCRGGGSIEDLWAFNSEKLARKIAECSLPVISAVGHEIDFTIADFVADLRAPTPSAAAEILSPNKEEWLSKFKNYDRQLAARMLDKIGQEQAKLTQLKLRIKHPGEQIESWSQRLDQIEIRLHNAIKPTLERRKSRFANVRQRLALATPVSKTKHHRETLERLYSRLHAANAVMHEKKSSKLQSLMELLHMVSPLATLQRGYSIARDVNGEIIRSTTQVKPGDKLNIRLSEGHIEAIVDKSH